jgi:glycine oxidase
MRTAPDVLIVGGGVIGCAVAHALAGPGRSILLVDQGAIGGEASGAAAGVLSVAGSGEDGVALALRAASLARFPRLVDELDDEAAVDVGFGVRGVLRVCLGDHDEIDARATLARRRADGFRVEWLDAEAARARVPTLHSGLRGALWCADDALVNAPRLVTALARAAERRGAQILPGKKVLGAEVQDGRVTRVRIGSEWITPGDVVLAAGAWTDRVAGMSPAFGIEPVAGEMIALAAGAPDDSPVITCGEGFLVPGPHGEVRVGATFAQRGFARANTAEGLARLSTWVAALAPAWSQVPVTRTWAGLRPFRSAGGPIIGRVPGRRNLVVASAHYRSGILLAPITAAGVRAALDGVAPPGELVPYSPPLLAM